MTGTIVVVGISCIYPGARNLQEYWENILAGRRGFRRIPDERMPLAEYGDSSRNDPDKTYVTRSALIDGFEFDWKKNLVPKGAFDATDVVHWLALSQAKAALVDSAIDLDLTDKERIGVVLGNSLTGEMSRANGLRLRWPYVERSVALALNQSSISIDQQQKILIDAENQYKAPLPVPNEDTLAGALSNVIAGRICNVLDFHGGGYTIDGACASSLLAVSNACDLLSTGRLDVVLAGGVDVSLDPLELVGFARTGALAEGEMRVYDKNSAGFLPGEGCGFVVLMRSEDAVERSLRPWATIEGWGMSSDGAGGITAPKSETQSLAMRRCYENATYSASELDFVEGHGTGTPVGDRVELSAILSQTSSGNEGNALARKEYRTIGVTSVKTLVGHTKAAAGIAGFIKAVLAVNQRIYPPLVGIRERADSFDSDHSHIYPITKARKFRQDREMRAGISSAGFGGINCHVSVASEAGQTRHITKSNSKIIGSNQNYELLIASGDSIRELADRLTEIRKLVHGMSEGELTDLAAHCSLIDSAGSWRIAVTAETVAELGERLDKLSTAIESDGESAKAPMYSQFGKAKESPRIGYLFPGQGSQFLEMGSPLVRRYSWAKARRKLWDKHLSNTEKGKLSECVDVAVERALNNEVVQEWNERLRDTRIAQPAICLTSLQWFEYLRWIGIEADVVAGHSLGEVTAMVAAGYLSEAEAIDVLKVRSNACSKSISGKTGSMIGLRCSYDEAVDLVEQVEHYAVIANHNAPGQLVIAGDDEAIEEVKTIAERRKIGGSILNVSNAFHSDYMDSAKQELEKFIANPPQMRIADIPLISGLTGGELPESCDIYSYLSDQVINPVRFVDVIQDISQKVDILVELGPGNTLASLARQSITNAIPVCSLEVSGTGRDRELCMGLGSLYTIGADIDWAMVYSGRFYRQFIPAHERTFFVNPCESIPEHADRARIIQLLQRKDQPVQESIVEKGLQVPKTLNNGSLDAMSVLMDLVVKETGYDYDMITGDMRLSDDLNLDSIKIAEIGNGLKNIGFSLEAEDEMRLATDSLEEFAGRLQISVQVLEGSASSRTEDAPTQSSIANVDVMGLLKELIVAETGFDLDMIADDMTMAEDLNLDSIKVAEIGEGLRRNGLEIDEADRANIATISLRNIVSLIHPEKPSIENGSDQLKHREPVAERSRVTRKVVAINKDLPLLELEVDFKPVDVPTIRIEKVLPIVILCTAESEDTAEEISDSLKSLGYVSHVEVHNEEGSDENTVEASRLIVVSDQRSARSSEIDHIDASINAGLINRISSWTSSGIHSISFISIGSTDKVRVNRFPVRALAQSISLDLPDLTVIAVETEASDSRDLIDWVTADVKAGAHVVKLENSLGSSEMRLAVNHSNGDQSDFDFDQDGIVLAIGGAKGITARCTLEIARETNAKVFLAGSSSAEELPSEVVDTLELYRRDGLSASYIECDVTDRMSVQRMLTRIEKIHGSNRIDAIVYGAGINRPAHIDRIKKDDIETEIAVKSVGLSNVLALIDKTQLSLCVGFSSVIGVVGMRGNSGYSIANEMLTEQLRALKVDYPAIRIGCPAYSVWSDIGMGAKLGVISSLESQNIFPVSVTDGVDSFIRCCKAPASSIPTVYAGPMLGLPTWNAARNVDITSTERFTENPVAHEPGSIVISRPELSIDRDDWIIDHDFRGTLLVPLVFSLTAMAQNARTLSNSERVTRVEELNITRPIIASKNQVTPIEVDARRVNAESTYVCVGEAGDAAQNPAFAALLMMADSHETGPVIEIDISGETVPKEVSNRIYESVLFQGQQFQRIQTVEEIKQIDEIRKAALLTIQREDSNGEPLPDPFFLDSMLQAMQILVPKDLCLPISVESIKIFQLANEAGIAQVKSEILERTSKGYLGRVTAVSPDTNEAIVIIDGLRLDIVESYKSRPDAEAFVDPLKYDKDQFQQYLLKALPSLGHVKACIELIDDTDKSKRRVTAKNMISVLAEVSEESVDWLDSGAPYLIDHEDIKVSVSHDSGRIVVAVSEGDIGCDIQQVERRKTPWKDLIPEYLKDTWRKCTELIGNPDRAGAIVWTVHESLIKVSATNVVVTTNAYENEILSFKVSGDKNGVIASTIMDLVLSGPTAVSVFSSLGAPLLPSAQEDKSPRGNVSHYSRTHIMTFKEAIPPMQSATAPVFFGWVGQLREEAMEVIRSPLTHAFQQEGKGMVTNFTDLIIHEPPMFSRPLMAWVWLDRQLESSPSTFELSFLWSHASVNGEGGVVCAQAKQRLTWVDVLGNGEVLASPFPDYFEDFLTERQPKYGNGPFYPPGLAKPTFPISSQPVWNLPVDDRDIDKYADVVELTTDDSHSNLVGNVYFSHYGVLAEKSCQSILKRHFSGSSGFFCQNLRIDHVGEAMPGDSLVTRAGLKRVTTTDCQLTIEIKNKSRGNTVAATGLATFYPVVMDTSRASRIPTTEIESHEIEMDI